MQSQWKAYYEFHNIPSLKSIGLKVRMEVSIEYSGLNINYMFVTWLLANRGTQNRLGLIYLYFLNCGTGLPNGLATG